MKTALSFLPCAMLTLVGLVAVVVALACEWACNAIDEWSVR